MARPLFACRLPADLSANALLRSPATTGRIYTRSESPYRCQSRESVDFKNLLRECNHFRAQKRSLFLPISEEVEGLLPPAPLPAAPVASSSRMPPSRPRVSARSHGLASGLRGGQRPASRAMVSRLVRRGP